MTRASRQLLLLILFRTSRSIAAGMIMLAFPYLVLTVLHYGAVKLGFIYSMAAVATAVLGLLFGFLADTWGRKRTLVAVGMLLPASSALVYFSHHLAILFLAGILGGYSATGSLMGGGVGGAAQPIQSAIIADLSTSENRTKYFSVLTFLSGVFAAVGALLAKFFHMGAIFLIATLVALAGLAFLWPLKTSEVRGDVRRLESKRTIGKFTITGILNGFTQGLIVPFLIPFFVIVFHIPRSRMAVYAFWSGMLAAVAILAAPWLERRMGFLRSLVVTRGMSAALLLFLPFVHYLVLALAIYILTPALRIMALPVQQTALTEMVGQTETGRALGINQVARLASSSGAIVLTGALFGAAEIAAPFLIYGGIMAANLGLYVYFFRRNPVDDRFRV
jgi:predicted MFS family arabinose efflux permease